MNPHLIAISGTPWFFDQTKFTVGPMELNSRELCLLAVLTLVISGILSLVIFDALKRSLSWLWHDSGLFGLHALRQSRKQATSGGKLKEAAPGILYFLWICGVSFVFVRFLTGWGPFRDFEIFLVLAGASKAYYAAREMAADKFRTKLGKIAGFFLLVDVFTSAHPHPLLWEAVYLSAFGLLMFGFWFLKLAANVDDSDDDSSSWLMDVATDSIPGCLWSALLVAGTVGVVIAWWIPGILFMLIHWSQELAVNVGDDLFLWVFYFPPVVLPLLIYKSFVPDAAAPADDDSHGDREEVLTVGLPTKVLNEPETPPDVTLKGRAGAVGAMAFASDGQILVTCGNMPGDSWGDGADGDVRLWRTDNGEQIGDTLRQHWQCVPAVAFSADGHVLATGSSDTGAVYIWNLDDVRRPVPTRARISFPFRRGSREQVFALTFASDGHLIAAVVHDREIVALWDLTSDRLVGKMVRVRRSAFELAPNPVLQIAISADRQLLAIMRTHRVEVWNMVTGRRIGRRIPGYSATFSADGGLLAIGDRPDVQVRDTLRNKRLGKPFTGHESAIGAVAFSPNGELLVSGSDDRTVCVWDPRTGQQLTRLKLPYSRDRHLGPYDVVSCLVVAPDNRTLAVADYSDRVWLWRLRPHDIRPGSDTPEQSDETLTIDSD